MGHPIHIDRDDLATTAGVLAAMSEASSDGWSALTAATDELAHGWHGVRSKQFNERMEALTESARELLTRLDAIAPQLRETIAGFVQEDQANASNVNTAGAGVSSLEL